MKGLFLDDERNPEDVKWITYPENIEWTIIRTYDEFIKEVKYNHFDILSFDHDIQDFSKGSELTGYDCLKYYCNHVGHICSITIHSMNPIGKANMLMYWNNFVKHKE